MSNPFSIDEKSIVGKILVVDDVAVNIQVLNEALAKNYQVLFALNGEDALKFATEKDPDIILLDVEMPGMNGFEVCEKLKSNRLTESIPILFVTSKDSEEDELKGLKLGAVDFITKPIRPEVVLQRVKNQITLVRYRETLEQLSFLDGLTGIFNRRCFDQVLKQEWHRSQRNKTPLGLILMDIDHFKKYNDLYGHLQGDSCLKQVAQILSDNVQRSVDSVARYGGEEFAIILPDTDLQGVIKIAENLCQAVFDQQIPHSQSEFAHVSLSMGAASLIAEHGKDPEILIEKVDEKLYQAKALGRNQVRS